MSTSPSYYFTQQGQGKDIVCLHGWGFHSKIWQFVVEYLSPRYRVTVIDLPGFGHSTAHVPYPCLAEISKKIAQIAPEPAIYLGWSLGGLVATSIAIHQPNKVSRLITISSSPRFLSCSDSNWPGVPPQTLEEFIYLFNHHPKRAWQRFSALQFYEHGLSHQKMSDLKMQLKFYALPPLIPALASLEILFNTDLRKNLKEITCPQLHIFGKNDKLIPAVETAKALQHLAKNCHISIMDHSGHAPFLSHPQEFLNIINRFLDNHS